MRNRALTRRASLAAVIALAGAVDLGAADPAAATCNKAKIGNFKNFAVRRRH